VCWLPAAVGHYLALSTVTLVTELHIGLPTVGPISQSRMAGIQSTNTHAPQRLADAYGLIKRRTQLAHDLCLLITAHNMMQRHPFLLA